MNAKASTATPLLAGLLMLVLGVPIALAGDDQKNASVSPEVKTFDAPPAEGASKDERCQPKPLPPHSGEHLMDREAKMLPGPTDPNAFKADPCYTDSYDAAAELQIFTARHLIDRPRPPVELVRRLYDRG